MVMRSMSGVMLYLNKGRVLLRWGGVGWKYHASVDLLE